VTSVDPPRNAPIWSAASAARFHDGANEVPDHRAPCRVNDPELWFAETPAGVEAAKALCRTCPIQAGCLAGALERGEPCGVWGGALFQQGAVIPYKRPRGRPRKDHVAA
jgi:WhiB family redox-sensing transcriptional regulator